MASPSRGLKPELSLHDALVQEIAHGLHDTAQPLAVLQGILELALIKAQTPADYRNVCQRALDELQRVNTGFDNVRKVLRSQAPTTACSPKKQEGPHHG
jgi:signal transduction histidine kinase